MADAVVHLHEGSNTPSPFRNPKHNPSQETTVVNMGGVDPSASTKEVPPSSSSSFIRPPLLKKSSPLYIACAGLIVFLMAIYSGSNLIYLSNRYHGILKKELDKPFFIFRWMGSKGVDTSDLQWYYFLICMPVSFFIFFIFTLISRRVRRRMTARHLLLAPSPTASRRRSSLRDDIDNNNNNSNSNNTDGDGSNSPSKNLYSSNYILGREIASLQLVHCAAGLFISFFISGPRFLFGLGLILSHYYFICPLIRRFNFTTAMAIMWTTQVAVLFLNYYFNGYSFSWFGLGFMDHYPSIIRWTVQYNMSVLRMIAFTNDYWEHYLLCREDSSNSNREASNRKSGVVEKRWRVLKKHKETCIDCAVIRDRGRGVEGTEESFLCYKGRTECSRAAEEYQNVWSYLAYLYYAPLFVAGPMISYNGYISYCHFPLRSINRRELVRYGIRMLCNALLLFTMMHFIHINAILVAEPNKRVEGGVAQGGGEYSTPPLVNKEENNNHNNNNNNNRRVILGKGSSSKEKPVDLYQKVMPQLGLRHRVMVFLYLLAFIWLKFNVIWKFFRLTALVEGVDTPEDMPRCFANVVSIQGFWRDWHASFNLWIVRYMYIPMGGSRRKFLSIFPIFFFIAIWHDIEMRLLLWAFYISICFIPEIICTLLFSSKTIPLIQKIKSNHRLYLILRIIAVQFTMTELILINLLGFAMGTEGLRQGLKAFEDLDWSFFWVLVIGFFAAAVLAVQDRDQEAYTKAIQRQRYGLLTPAAAAAAVSSPAHNYNSREK